MGKPKKFDFVHQTRFSPGGVHGRGTRPGVHYPLLVKYMISIFTARKPELLTLTVMSYIDRQTDRQID